MSTRRERWKRLENLLNEMEYGDPVAEAVTMQHNTIRSGETFIEWNGEFWELHFSTPEPKTPDNT